MITRPTRTYRPGLTLTEALIALFVAAIGMLSLMVLFPLGALQMGQALKDERTSQLAMQADAKLRWHWQKYIVESALDPYVQAMDNPHHPNSATLPTPAGSEPSYPVLVDPIGWNSWNGRNEWLWVADQKTQSSALPRRTLFRFDDANNPYGSGQGLNSTAKAVAFCSLLDDLTYTTDGRPDPAVTVERQGRYNWLAVVQRPDVSQPNTANLTIVVFDGRAPGYPAPGSERSFTVNAANGGQFTPGSSSLTISYTGERPPITKGRWVMDATTESAGAKLRHANFYRVVSVNDETPNVLELELQTPIRRSDNGTAPYDGTLVVLYAASEVFERPPLTARQGP